MQTPQETLSVQCEDAEAGFCAKLCRLALVATLGLGLSMTAMTPATAQTDTPEADDGFTFVVVGHPRGDADNEPFVFREELIDAVAKVDPDLVVITGDMIWGDWFQPGADRTRITEHWDRFDAAWSRLGVPIYRVPGNHDINDPVTRDVYFERYGDVPQAATFKNNRFILLATPYIVEGDTPPTLPRENSRVTELPADQVDFLKSEIAGSSQYDNTFVFTHHVLWRSPDMPWWRDVEPAITDGTLRAVFSGDFGPSKFAYLEKNGIEYYQSAVSHTQPPDQIYTGRGAALNLQFDNFLAVTVDGEAVDIEVKTFGAQVSSRHSPEYWQAAFAKRPQTVQQQIREFIGGPKRQALLGGLLVLGFVLGALVTRLLGRKSNRT